MVSDHERDPFIESIASELRRPVRLDPRLDDRVMAAVREPTVIPIRTATPAPARRWSERRWTISVSPLGGLAAAAAAGVLAIAGIRELRSPDVVAPSVVTVPADLPLRPVANLPAGTELVETQFTIIVPGARSVALVGDFNDWDPTRTPMQRLTAEGLWSVSLPLSVGLHEYQFIVDGSTRVNDPTTPQASSDFGSANSVISVAPRGQVVP